MNVADGLIVKPDTDTSVRDADAASSGVGDPGGTSPAGSDTRQQRDPGKRSTSARKDAFALALLAILSIAGWILLFRSYGLFEHRNNTHFAFEKIPGGFDSPVMRQTLIVFLAIAAAYAAAIWLLESASRITPLVLSAIGLLVAGPAVGSVLLYPVGALDVFNYMIELKLAFHYDENPYLVTFEGYRTDSYALPAFLVNITLFYGPAWLLASWIPAAVAGFEDVIHTLVAMKVFNLGLLMVTAFLIGRYQRDWRSGWIAATLFLANPLVLFEGVTNAHNDVLLTAFLIGAIFALQRRSVLAGPLLALSALVKFYTVALVPIFLVVALQERWGWKRAISTTLLTAVTVAVVCAPYWGEGKLVDGLRTGLEQSQVMDHVSPLSLTLQYAQQREAEGRPDAEMLRSRPSIEILPKKTASTIRNVFAAGFAVVALLLAASVWKGRSPELAAAETVLLLMLLMTNLYGWYLIPVFALFALRRDLAGKFYIAVATALGLVYYPMFVYAHFSTEWGRFQVHLFLALFLTVPILVYLLARVTSGLRLAFRGSTAG